MSVISKLFYGWIKILGMGGVSLNRICCSRGGGGGSRIRLQGGEVTHFVVYYILAKFECDVYQSFYVAAIKLTARRTTSFKLQ